MASLTEVYRHGRGEASRERLFLGSTLFFTGALAVLCAVVVASTDLGTAVGLSRFQGREVAGVLGGLGVPAVALAILVILPGVGRTVRLGAGIGVAVCVAGVGLFTVAYPWQWLSDSGGTSLFALGVLGVYFVGGVVTLWGLFSGVANFKTRNEPGGTVRMEVTREGRTRIVEVEGSRLSNALGGIGLLGSQPDGEVETQTNWHPAQKRQSRKTTHRQATDGGSTDHAVVTHSQRPEPETSRPKTDPYCGNCESFRYVRTEGGLTPYCGYHEHLMDDMEPCEDWQFNADH